MTILDTSDQALTAHEQGLATFIASRWLGSFPFSYQMPQGRGPAASAWVKWQEAHSRSTARWTCQNLAEAASFYAWDGDADRADLLHYDSCREALLDALWKVNDETVALAACLRIFKWGGVAKREDDPSRLWVASKAKDQQLVSELKRAMGLLKGASDPSGDFGRYKLPMNSSVTKLYAIGDKEGILPIFDGRVGAALAIIVVAYARSEGLTAVPPELQFGYFENQNPRRTGSRNPSRDVFRFRTLGEHSFHARCMWRCCRLLQRVQAQLGGEVSILNLERALFMIGYDVSEFQ